MWTQLRGTQSRRTEDGSELGRRQSVTEWVWVGDNGGMLEGRKGDRIRIGSRTSDNLIRERFKQTPPEYVPVFSSSLSIINLSLVHMRHLRRVLLPNARKISPGKWNPNSCSLPLLEGTRNGWTSEQYLTTSWLDCNLYWIHFSSAPRPPPLAAVCDWFLECDDSGPGKSLARNTRMSDSGAGAVRSLIPLLRRLPWLHSCITMLHWRELITGFLRGVNQTLWIGSQPHPTTTTTIPNPSLSMVHPLN